MADFDAAGADWRADFDAVGVDWRADFDAVGVDWRADFDAVGVDWRTPLPSAIDSVQKMPRPVTASTRDGCWKIPCFRPGSFHRLCFLLYCFLLFWQFLQLLLFP
ncbi:hypothetical protein AALA00_05570 [Lachnospiraceae bacterium 46-15]